jgi:cyanate permease
MATMAVASSSLGPFLAGLARDTLGSFDVAMLTFAIAPLPIALLSLWAVPPARPADSIAVPIGMN